MNDQYSTDKWIMDLFRDWYDPCPLNYNYKVDGLGLDWLDQTFVNPPYSNPLAWVMKAIEENKKGKTIVLLLRVDTSTNWFKLLVEANAHILFIHKRLKFNTGKSANFPSMLVILSSGVEE